MSEPAHMKEPARKEPALAPVSQMKMRESVYEQLSAAFTRGQFAPGDVLNLRNLAAQLGTSLTPVREAVRRLVAEGALVDTASRTLEVPKFDRARMVDLKRARIALEQIVVELAMANMNDETLRAMRAVLARPSNLDISALDLAQNYDFHFTLYRASRSSVLLPIIEGLWVQYGPYLNLIIRKAAPSIGTGNEFHEEIVEAAVTGNTEAAKAAIVKDIVRSFDVLHDFEPE